MHTVSALAGKGAGQVCWFEIVCCETELLLPGHAILAATEVKKRYRSTSRYTTSQGENTFPRRVCLCGGGSIVAVCKKGKKVEKTHFFTVARALEM